MKEGNEKESFNKRKQEEPIGIRSTMEGKDERKGKNNSNTPGNTENLSSYDSMKEYLDKPFSEEEAFGKRNDNSIQKEKEEEEILHPEITARDESYQQEELQHLESYRESNLNKSKNIIRRLSIRNVILYIVLAINIIIISSIAYDNYRSEDDEKEHNQIKKSNPISSKPKLTPEETVVYESDIRELLELLYSSSKFESITVANEELLSSLTEEATVLNDIRNITNFDKRYSMFSNLPIKLEIVEMINSNTNFVVLYNIQSEAIGETQRVLFIEVDMESKLFKRFEEYNIY